MQVVKLPGLPEPETTEFTVTFATKAPKVQLGAFKQELRLDLKPGPPVSVMIYANVTLPELRLSDEQTDFGNVIVGRCQTCATCLPDQIACLTDSPSCVMPLSLHKCI